MTKTTTSGNFWKTGKIKLNAPRIVSQNQHQLSIPSPNHDSLQKKLKWFYNFSQRRHFDCSTFGLYFEFCFASYRSVNLKSKLWHTGFFQKKRTLGQFSVHKIAPAFVFWKNPGQHIFFFWDFLTFSWAEFKKEPKCAEV